jgi:hypothetical protein
MFLHPFPVKRRVNTRVDDAFEMNCAYHSEGAFLGSKHALLINCKPISSASVSTFRELGKDKTKVAMPCDKPMSRPTKLSRTATDESTLVPDTFSAT